MSVTVQHEIPPDRWAEFGRSFGDAHRGWITEARRTDGRTERWLWHEANLKSVDLVVTEVGDDTAAKLIVTASLLGAPSARETTHAVAHRPTWLAALETEDGRHMGLIVEEASGATLELLFRVSARPIDVDGLA